MLRNQKRLMNKISWTCILSYTNLLRYIELKLKHVGNFLISVRILFETFSEIAHPFILGAIIEKGLYRHNRHCIRLMAFRCLLDLISILCDNMTSEVTNKLIDYLSYTFDFKLYSPTVGLPHHNILEPPDAHQYYFSTRSTSTTQELNELIVILLDHISKDENLFGIWFNIIKERFLLLLYPSQLKDIGVYTIQGHTGFQTCPHQLHEIFTTKLHVWFKNNTFRAILWDDLTSIFLLNLFQSTFRDYDITRNIVSLENCLSIIDDYIIRTKDPVILKQVFLQERIKSLTESIIQVLTIKSTYEDTKNHRRMIGKVLNILQFVSSEYHDVLLEETSLSLQNGFMEAVIGFFGTHASSKLDDSKFTVASIADDILDTLFKIWIKSKFTTIEMWQYFVIQLIGLSDWPQLIRQWKIKILWLTKILCHLIKSPLPLENIETLDINWTKEYAQHLWFTFLSVIVNVFEIKSATSFHEAMRCIQKMTAIMNEELTSKGITIPSEIHPVNVFLSITIEACYATGESARGVVTAISNLCDLFYKTTLESLPAEMLAHFYRILIFTMRSEYAPVSDQVIIEIKNIFSRNLPGSSILIPEVIESVENIFRPKHSAPLETQRSAVTLLSSLICYPNHFDGVGNPCISVGRIISSGDLKDVISALLLSLPSNTLMDPFVKSLVMNGITLLLFEDTLHRSHKPATLQKVFICLISFLTQPNEMLAIAASELLRALSYIFDHFYEIDANIPFSVVSSLCDIIINMLKEQQTLIKEKIIVSLIETLGFWLNAGPNELLRKKELSDSIFRLVEIGLFGQMIPLKQQSDLGSETYHLRPTLHSMEPFYQKPKHGSLLIRNATEYFLYNTLNSYNNFSTLSGYRPDSLIQDDETEPIMYFVNNDEQVISIQQLSTEGSDYYIRYTVRDSIGAYSWDCRIDYEEGQDLINQFEDPVPVGDLPLDDSNVKKSDILTSVLLKFNEVHMPTLPKDPKFVNFTTPIRDTDFNKEHICIVRNSIEALCKFEQGFFDNYIENRSKVERLPPKPPKPKSTSHLARLFLSHMGYLSPISRRNLIPIAPNEEFYNQLQKLDCLTSRRQCEFTIINTLHSEELKPPSQLYLNFMHGLGFAVDLDTHTLYRGTNGFLKKGYYYSNPFEEIFFASSTDMSIDDIPKNQVVTILWNEGSKSLEKYTYLNKNCDAVIEIRPISNGLIHISITHKGTEYITGPLQDGSLVSPLMLPILVRITATSIYRAYSQSNSKSNIPSALRKSLIRDICQFKKVDNADLFFAKLFKTKYDQVRRSISSPPKRSVSLKSIENSSLPMYSQSVSDISPSNESILKSQSMKQLPTSSISNEGPYLDTPFDDNLDTESSSLEPLSVNVSNDQNLLNEHNVAEPPTQQIPSQSTPKRPSPPGVSKTWVPIRKIPPRKLPQIAPVQTVKLNQPGPKKSPHPFFAPKKKAPAKFPNNNPSST